MAILPYSDPLVIATIDYILPYSDPEVISTVPVQEEWYIPVSATLVPGEMTGPTP